MSNTKLILAVCIFASGLGLPPPATAFEFTTTLPAPRGTTPDIDGERSEGEWDDALRVELLGGGEMFLKHDDESLYMLVIARKPGRASICIERADGIRVLHASAALGAAEYAGRFNAATLTRGFTFELTDPGAGLAARKARKRHLAEELWFASTSTEGSNLRELQISLDIAAERGRIPMAVAFFMPDDNLLAYWPEDLADGCIDPGLLKGMAPDSLDFEPHRWPVVTVEPHATPGDR